MFNIVQELLLPYHYHIWNFRECAHVNLRTQMSVHLPPFHIPYDLLSIEIRHEIVERESSMRSIQSFGRKGLALEVRSEMHNTLIVESTDKPVVWMPYGCKKWFTSNQQFSCTVMDAFLLQVIGIQCR
jgi:hypothetical protein